MAGNIDLYYPFLINYYKKIFKGFYYTVQLNDTLEIISKRYKIPANNIISINGLVYPYNIKEGDVIFIPGLDEPISPHKGTIYTVRYGDSLDSISKKYNISVEKLMESNFIVNKSTIFVGQRLLIPGDENEQKDNQTLQEESSTKDEIKIYPLSPFNPTNNISNIINKKFSVLKRGMRGSNVSTLQRMICALGYNVKRLDGTFGYELEKQIKLLQKEADIEPTGIVDHGTWEYIFNSINKKPSSFVK